MQAFVSHCLRNSGSGSSLIMTPTITAMTPKNTCMSWDVLKLCVFLLLFEFWLWFLIVRCLMRFGLQFAFRLPKHSFFKHCMRVEIEEDPTQFCSLIPPQKSKCLKQTCCKLYVFVPEVFYAAFPVSVIRCTAFLLKNGQHLVKDLAENWSTELRKVEKQSWAKVSLGEKVLSPVRCGGGNRETQKGKDLGGFSRYLEGISFPCKSPRTDNIETRTNLANTLKHICFTIFWKVFGKFSGGFW